MLRAGVIGLACVPIRVHARDSLAVGTPVPKHRAGLRRSRGPFPLAFRFGVGCAKPEALGDRIKEKIRLAF